MNRLIRFAKKEAVFLISSAAALISAFFVPPSREYIGYINFGVLCLLFALMSVVAGFSRLNVFTRTAEELIRIGARGGLRAISAVLWGLCFFCSMFITNDVALITFVPLAITLLVMIDEKKSIIPVVVLQTVAANLGSMLTPIGNPQNLYLFDTFDMTPGVFFAAVLPYGALSFLLLSAANLILVKKRSITPEIKEKTELGSSRLLVLYAILSALSLLTVAKVVDHRITAASVALSLIIFDRGTFKSVDWFLLLTFVMFFIFVGNIASIDSVKAAVSGMIRGREVLSAILLSQVISNVPCAAMLSGFADNGTALLIGTDLGGLGTLIASLASLISFRLYCANVQNADKKNYLICFTFINVIFLLILYAFYVIVRVDI